eukprot:GILK01017045.1.p1 GENE.GILK01017045.1~~GILK01017045.1.p1  ORF type:complete len:647 (+),score=71.74 GILK01017045.1:117-2057(+)
MATRRKARSVDDKSLQTDQPTREEYTTEQKQRDIPPNADGTSLGPEPTDAEHEDRKTRAVRRLQAMRRRLKEKPLSPQVHKAVVWSVLGLAACCNLILILSPSRSFVLSSHIFLQLVGVAHLAAFASIWPQLQGLVGSDGILPVTNLMETAKGRLADESRWSKYMSVPTLCWLSCSDRSLRLHCIVGVLSACLVCLGVGQCLLLPVLWITYLSIKTICKSFLALQWDSLLLETTVFAWLMTPWTLYTGPFPTATLAASDNSSKDVSFMWNSVSSQTNFIFLIWWLVFRLMFSSGVVKLYSGCPEWSSFRAMSFHYETQPLPNPISWFFHCLPMTVHKVETVMSLFLELVVPIFMLIPHPICQLFGFLGTVGLMLLIATTGSYGFFNWLTITLCVPLLDDATLIDAAKSIGINILNYITVQPFTPESTVQYMYRWAAFTLSLGLVACILALSYVPLAINTRGRVLPSERLFDLYATVCAVPNILNTYGLFARMTTVRDELIIEGSNDARDWQPYETRYKPGDPSKRPCFIPYHMPRLDWRLWFCPLSNILSHQWVLSLAKALLLNSPSVLGLFKHNPFPEAAPRFIRMVRYNYKFVPWKERKSKNWWNREYKGLYCPVVCLDDKNELRAIRLSEDTDVGLSYFQGQG